MKIYRFILIAGLICLAGCTAEPQQNYRDLIAGGEFAKAAELIQHRLQNDKNISEQERLDLLFEIERMDRIKKDFTKTQPEVVDFIRKYIPAVTFQDINNWEKERSLERMMIDGEERYFNYAARNLFRINKECLRIWNEKHVDELTQPPAPGALNLDEHIKAVRDEVVHKNRTHVMPVRLCIHYTISVNPDVIPAGEPIRCWIPFPREIASRQTNIALKSTNPLDHQLAPNTDLQRMIYLEKKTEPGKPTEFGVEYEYTSYGVYHEIDSAKVKPVDAQGPLKAYLDQEFPHIVFTDTLRQLSKRLIGSETNPYRIAQILFAWIDENIPWASAREYSTIPNLPMYAYENRHGDCGIQTMLFMTLCRMNGIPARWQSGWEFQPPDDSMHDWGMIYFEPYGWVPMDVTYGLRKSDDEKLKWFYLNGMDSYRLIFNDAITQPFTPAKQHFRSETVDSQRGEVEWAGGNLYFDQWDWNMKWEVLNP